MRWLWAFPAMVLMVTAAMAADPHAEGHTWFQGKRSAGGRDCCENKHCHVLEADQWAITAEGFTVYWTDGKAYSMPMSRVQPIEDPKGRAAGCVVNKELVCGFVEMSY